MPWMTANDISIHYDIAGEGPSVVLLHEMGGTLDSWDEIAPALRRRFRVLRYDQRGAGLSEKVRKPYGNDTLTDDLQAVLKNTGLAPPYHFVAVAAATAQALVLMSRHPEQIGSFVFCNPLAGIDPNRAGALNDRAGLAEREGMRAALSVTLDKSWPAEIGDRARYDSLPGALSRQRPGVVRHGQPHAGTHRHQAAGERRPLPDHDGGRSLRSGAPPAGSEEFARAIPGARFRLIDACHMMPAQAPDLLLPLIDDFLTRHAAPAA